MVSSNYAAGFICEAWYDAVENSGFETVCILRILLFRVFLVTRSVCFLFCTATSKYPSHRLTTKLRNTFVTLTHIDVFAQPAPEPVELISTTAPDRCCLIFAWRQSYNLSFSSHVFLLTELSAQSFQRTSFVHLGDWELCVFMKLTFCSLGRPLNRHWGRQGIPYLPQECPRNIVRRFFLAVELHKYRITKYA